MSLTEAQNPKTPTARLLELFQTHQHKYKQALAQNPSTPHHILMHLASEYPHEFLRNPVIPMLLLEDPNLLHKLSPRACADLIEETSEEWVLRSLAHFPDVGMRFLLCRKQDLSLGIIEILLQDPRPDVRALIARHPLTPKSFLEECAQSDDEEKQTLALCSPSIDATLIERLSTSTNVQIRENVACHPQCPAHTLEALSQDPDINVRANVASNPATPSHILLRLARHPGQSPLDQLLVLSQVEENPNASLDALFYIVFADHFALRSAAIRSLRFGSAFVRLFLQSSDESTRVMLASRKRLTLREQEMLCEDESQSVREALAENPHVDETILRLLAHSPQRPGASFFSVPKRLARNPSTPKDLLEELSRDTSVTEEIARNPGTPAHLLAQLARDRSSIRAHVASNPSTPEAMLRELLDDDSYSVRVSAKRTLKQQKQPPTAISEPEIFPDEIPGVKTVQDLVRYLATHPDDELRARIKAATHTPEILRNALR